MPIQKPWQALTDVKPAEIPGTVGVYELGDAAGRVIYIGFAGGRSRFGLRGAVLEYRSRLESEPGLDREVTAFRYEVTTNYLVRQLDLLSRHQAEYGCLPAGNEASAEVLPPLARYRVR